MQLRVPLFPLVLVALIAPALGCGEKVKTPDPVTAEQQIKTQKEMVQQERAIQR